MRPSLRTHLLCSVNSTRQLILPYARCRYMQLFERGQEDRRRPNNTDRRTVVRRDAHGERTPVVKYATDQNCIQTVNPLFRIGVCPQILEFQRWAVLRGRVDETIPKKKVHQGGARRDYVTCSWDSGEYTSSLEACGTCDRIISYLAKEIRCPAEHKARSTLPLCVSVAKEVGNQRSCRVRQIGT